MDARLASLNMVKKQRDMEKQQVDKHDSADKKIKHELLAEQEKEQQVQALMDQHKALYRDAKYQEALVLAQKARDLDPDNVAAGAAIHITTLRINESKAQGNKDGKDKYALEMLNDTDKVGPPVDMDNPLAVNQRVSMQARDRKSIESLLKINNVHSEKEHAIYRRLDQPISSMDFKDTPLKQILDDLQGLTGINIVTDVPALNDAGVSLDTQITMRLDGIALKSALNLLLHQVHLTYVVQDEVLNITTDEHARGKMITRIHPVLDLVTPIPNSDGASAPSALKTAMAGGEPALKLAGIGPTQSLHTLPGGMDTTQTGGTSPTGAITTNNKDKDKGASGLEDTLMHLIINTIRPESWAQMGGHGTIEFYPLGQALVINQTPDIQEQIAELLQALRRLQDQEVAIEIRFITVAESFFERIGVDFNVNIRTDNTKYQPQIVSQQFQPFGFINHFTPNRFLSGLTPGGSLTQDLNIPVKNSSFGMAIPPFGEYPNIPGGNGGLSLGLAFLSDIEVTMFLEAAQGDQRTNVMEAPKLTLFNGQTSTISVTDQQFFVTAVQVIQAGGQIVFVPSNNLFPTGGINLTMNAVISADRRFVRMSLAPNLSSLASANVPLFPITTFITPVFEGGAVGQPVPFTQFIQQPTLNTLSVNTTVNVPDGGTVLMGGLKRLNEGRNEFGPPILSKIPYINRLFKNVGYGREAESLMIMVTPRIIINEEEELKAVPGLGSSTPAQEQVGPGGR
jgi:type II secretory pathway component GspD/PulD (secretin)